MDIQTFQQTYLQVEQINKGGTGTIYRAYHRNLGKYVVLKNIEIGNIDIKRREVDILKNLRHRYLPTIYDFIEVEGRQFIVEDYIKGTDLEVYLKNKIRLPQEQLMKWMAQMCEVLEYLHTRKPIIIHSDIKPGNIMIDEHGDICLIDFNISILHENKAVVLGYSNYFCSPEQLAQAKALRAGYGSSSVTVDCRSDIYSMAATFYALISGSLPLCGAQNVPLSGMKIPYTEGFLCLIDRCMHPLPSKRFHSAKQVAAMLNRTEVLTKKYKKYVFMRNMVSILGTLVFVLGIITLGFGEGKRNSYAYNKDYQQISQEFQMYGANSEVFRSVQEILDEGKYRNILKKNHIDKATLYAIEAEYYFSFDTVSGYKAAMDCYKKASDTVASENKDKEFRDKLIRNYITSAALAGEKEEAQAAVRLHFGADNDFISNAVEAEIAYSFNDYDNVLTYANNIRASAAQSYPDVRKNVYNVAALACAKTDNLNGVIEWYMEIYRLEPTDDIKRCLVAAYIDAGICETEKYKAASYFNQAAGFYNQITTKTHSDKINHAQILYSTGEYDKSLEVLNNVTVKDNLLLCKKYYILSLIYYELNGKQINAESQKYCHEAISLYNELGREQKKGLSVSLLENLKQILGMGLEIKR